MSSDALMIVLLALGFGFVIFFHELGHFLAAKWVGIKVEQFAVGFGQAIVAWRQGIGFRVGTTTPEYRRRVDAWIAAREQENGAARNAEIEPTFQQEREAEKALGLGETEYRLNWLPLGGYVKMLGQDDLKPNAAADDPRAYNRKSVGARMVVVSAGVIMNIILAAIGFMIVFRMGFNVPPPVVGGLLPDSPAQRAGLRVGDVIDTLDGKKQWDFTKIGLSAALLEDGVAVPIVVERDHRKISLEIVPARPKGSASDFLSLGIEARRDLRGPKEGAVTDTGKLSELYLPEELGIKPGDVITEVNGHKVSATDVALFDQIVQASEGEPVKLTVKNSMDSYRTIKVQPHFADPFSAGSFHLVGMVPRAEVMSVLPESPARGKLLPGDVVLSLTRANGQHLDEPSPARLTAALREAGDTRESISMEVLRGGKVVPVSGLVANLKVGDHKHGLGISVGMDEAHPVVGDVLKETPASRAGIPPRVTITNIGQTPIHNWYDIHRALMQTTAETPVRVDYLMKNNEHGSVEMKIDPEQWAAVRAVRYETVLQLAESDKTPRKAENLVEAASWGVTETRDFVLQFYLTLRRMIGGSVSPANMMGPVGIFTAGTKIASRGTDWLIWFLAMISANLAVVNFLPIPIVDGGLFTFLIMEKIQGRPLSPRTQTIAQYVGLAFLAGVFLFVTYHDIARWF